MVIVGGKSRKASTKKEKCELTVILLCMRQPALLTVEWIAPSGSKVAASLFIEIIASTTRILQIEGEKALCIILCNNIAMARGGG